MKAILVLKEMPKMCLNCPCFKYQMDETGICCGDVNGEMAYGLDMHSKPSWCPIKQPLKYGDRDYLIFNRKYLMENLDKEIKILKRAEAIGQELKDIKGVKIEGRSSIFEKLSQLNAETEELEK